MMLYLKQKQKFDISLSIGKNLRFAFEEDDDENKESGGRKSNELQEMTSADESSPSDELGNRVLKTVEKIKRDEMEKNAGWWNKYYASKARLV